MKEKNALNFGKDSLGYYFSTNVDTSEQYLPLQDQKTNDYNLNNIILQKPNEYKNEIFSTSNLLEKEF